MPVELVLGGAPWRRASPPTSSPRSCGPSASEARARTAAANAAGVAPRPGSLFSGALAGPALRESVTKLDPRQLVRNPVMFTTAVVALLATVLLVRTIATGGDVAFEAQLVFWLWLTVLFGNVAEALAEGRGRAQAASLRSTKAELQGKRVRGAGHEVVAASRLIRFNVLAKSGRAVEAAGDIDVLLLDKTGTITLGDRQASAFVALSGVPERDIVEAARLSSLADETPEGRSIVALAGGGGAMPAGAKAVPFTAQTRVSGVDIGDRRIRKGAVDALIRLETFDADAVRELKQITDRIARAGGTPLAAADGARLLGAVHLKDVVKAGIKERFAELRRMGIRTVMITGDNPLTAAAIAAESGVDDFLAEATPEDKLALIRREQAGGRLVAMCGDGTNDAPALAQSDVGVAMNTGTQAAREAGNMVDLDNDPTKLIEVVGIGKQLLMTRGALTTFSISNDVAKYFAILPAIFAALYPGLGALNVMGLASPESAILSAIVFNALIIPLLVPLALRGVAYRPQSAARQLVKNLGLYGAGGLVAPFLGIKLIDLAVSGLGLR